ncbi:aminoacyl-histidine dipeptidase [Bacteroidales bacterium OttesenSCG-928-M11]|nr:aminoacyl-histidine dipeptidase [Bacteroidales bacterium OttesenSCG-928-M11]
MNVKDLEPRLIWGYFDEITRVPRPSKKEEKIVQYLVDFAKKHQLDFKQDDAMNVVIYKPASPGKENLKSVILQSHIDMVCEKNADTEFNFDTDPIQTYIDGDWVKAKGTTLGADDGIGMAAALAILASPDLEHGEIIALFTSDEETGLTGANALDPSFLDADILLNLDSEDWGEFCIGCAGGKNIQGIFEYSLEVPPSNYFWFDVRVSGLNGGHSGSDIHVGLGNANKILNRYLWTLMSETSLYLVEIDGGNLHNAIAREASAKVGVPYGLKERAAVLANIMQADLSLELGYTDKNVKLEIQSSDSPSQCIDQNTTSRLLNTIYALPHGVIGWSHEMENTVETSTNLAAVKMRDGNKIVVLTSQRSSTSSLKTDICNMVNSVFRLAGANVVASEGYPGWKPNADSPILKVSETIYEEMFGKKPRIYSIHAGLECGLFSEKNPRLDMISCGPTILGAHSPDERMEISTVAKWWSFMLELLKQIPVK